MILLAGFLAGIVLALVAANFFPNERKLQHLIECHYGIEDAQFLRAIGSLIFPAPVDGNRITELRNGTAAFSAMLAALRGAKHTVTFESFIFWKGKIAHEFTEELKACARRGVRVFVLLDTIGASRMKRGAVRDLRRHGCQVRRYHPFKWYHLTRLNNRTHRKLLVVDGRIGFTGGIGIGDEWQGNADALDHWRDTHFQIEGPVVAQMQGIFMINWVRVRAKVEHTAEFFPELPPVGTQLAQMFNSSPREGSENARFMFLFSIAAARSRVLLEQAYFVPDALLIRTLVAAAQRGVRVEIIVPGPLTDIRLVRRASRALWGPLLRAGVRIFEYQPTNLHTKTMTADGIWSSVGSANFDFRALRTNDEANLNVYDRTFAAQLESAFAADKAQSREITYEEWKRRPALMKLWERFWSLFRVFM